MTELSGDAGTSPTTVAAPATGLVDLLDRIVDTGVSVTGDVVIALAGVDLIRVDLRLLLIGVESALESSMAGFPVREGAAR